MTTFAIYCFVTGLCWIEPVIDDVPVQQVKTVVVLPPCPQEPLQACEPQQ